MASAAPGVSIEFIPSGLLAIESASTSTAAFIGFARRGPLNEPVLVAGLDDFIRSFGRIDDTSSGIADDPAGADHLGHAVNGFFLNGGSKAYITRVVDSAAARPVSALAGIINLALPAANPAPAFEFTARSSGTWGNDLHVVLSPVDDEPVSGTTRFTLAIGKRVAKSTDFRPIENLGIVQLGVNTPRDIRKIVARGSALVSIEDKPGAGAAGKVMAYATLQSGADITSAIDVTGNAASKKLTLQVDGVQVEVAFSTANMALADVAVAIQSAVRLAPPQDNEGLTKFTCVVRGKRLILQSGSMGASSAITIAAGAVADTLKLSVDGVAGKTIMSMETTLSGGTDGTAPNDVADYNTAFSNLEPVRDASIILLPGKFWSSGGNDKTIYEAAITHCEKTKNRVVIIDPSSGELTTRAQVEGLGLPPSSFACLYYPHVTVANPHYNPETAANKEATFDVGSAAFAAGMWARFDKRLGVWWSAAGITADVRGILGTTREVRPEYQENLNELGINCIRRIVGPNVIWGARMLCTRSEPDYRYVSVRRTAILIGESLYNALQAVVFKPNNHILWATLRSNITAFLDGLFRAGAFQGDKPDSAYFVNCGLGATMTQADIDNGIVKVRVGFRGLKPAEFIIVEIQQIVQRP